MPTDTLTRRLGRIEFFATIPAGLLIFYFLYTAIYMLSWFRYGPGDTVTLDLLIPVGEGSSHLALVIANQVLLDHLTQSPTALALVLVISYMFGSVVRSFSLRRFDYREWFPIRSDVAPYMTDVEELVANLNESREFLGIPEESISEIRNWAEGKSRRAVRDVYSYWKFDLRTKAPEIYSYYESIASHSRFFANMIWACVIGFAANAASFIVVCKVSHSGGLNIPYAPYVISIGLPLILFLVFFLQLPRGRAQEIKTLLTLRILQRQSETKASCDSPSTPKK